MGLFQGMEILSRVWKGGPGARCLAKGPEDLAQEPNNGRPGQGALVLILGPGSQELVRPGQGPRGQA